jgi:hypothetical protein
MLFTAIPPQIENTIRELYFRAHVRSIDPRRLAPFNGAGHDDDAPRKDSGRRRTRFALAAEPAAFKDGSSRRLSGLFPQASPQGITSAITRRAERPFGSAGRSTDLDAAVWSPN